LTLELKRLRDEPEASAARMSIPRIYYATRTHSQIAQVLSSLALFE
jgi:hypothetical protein